MIERFELKGPTRILEVKLAEEDTPNLNVFVTLTGTSEMRVEALLLLECLRCCSG